MSRGTRTPHGEGDGSPEVAPARRSRDAYDRFERTRSSLVVGGAVKAMRKRAGLTQMDLAELTGTTQPAIARLECGRVSPTVALLDRIARAVGADLVVEFDVAPRPGASER